ncbi:MAG: TfoX/Sxy family protein [bacterium]
MPTSQSTIDYLTDQFSFLPNFHLKKMFGEYGIYNGDKYFGLICDEKLFFKSTKELVAKIGDDGLRAYPGSKNSLHIPEEIVEDKDRLEKLTLEYLR